MQSQIPMTMNSAWDLKTDDSRTFDSLYTFIIFCEDDVSEYHYFKWFETPSIKINIIRKQKSMLTNVKKAITYCTEHGILVFKENKHILEISGIEIWCVFDRDIESNPNEIIEKNNEFNLSISLAEQNDINVAWSNDAFELWILLHLLDVNPLLEDAKSRTYYYGCLTEYFKNHPNPNLDLAKALSHATFSYKRDLKSKTNFVSIVRNEIVPKTQIALERSIRLFEINKSKANHYDKRPCTSVHNLVISLLEKGGKEIPNSDEPYMPNH